MSVKWINVYVLAFISLISFLFSASAQELDPRAYQPAQLFLAPIIQKNSRLGGTVTISINRNQSVKFAVNQGVIATGGGDFTNLDASYNYAWANK